MAEGLGLAGDLAGVAFVPHRGHFAVAGTGNHEAAGKDFVPRRLADRVGFAGQHRLVDGQPAGTGHPAVGDDLLAGREPDQVAGDDLVGQQLEVLPVPDHLGPRRDQDRQPVEGLLRPQLLADADPGVDDRDHPEDRIGDQAKREDQDEEDRDDQVEQGEDVAGDDARGRPRGVGLGRAQRVQSFGRLGRGEPGAGIAGGQDLGHGFAHGVIVTGWEPGSGQRGKSTK